ncbi:hypothetical protein FF021_18220, partial [Leptospira noguchii]
FEPTTRFIESVVLSFKRDLSNDLKRFRKKRFAEFGERCIEFRKAFCFSSFIDPFRFMPNSRYFSFFKYRNYHDL